MLEKIFTWIGAHADSIGWAILVIIGLSLLWKNN
jgi:hypothetical protein